MHLRHLLAVCASLGLVSSSWAQSNSVVNLSHYDEMRPDFAAMKAQGIVGVIHEVSYPPRQIDEKYAARQEGALRAGLLWGAYHFADASSPSAQADHFVDTISRKWNGGPRPDGSPGVLMVLDFEVNNHYPGGTMRPDQAAEFVERVRSRTGKYPGLYSGEFRIRDVLNSPKVSASTKATLTKCWLWIANYHFVPKATAPWSRWTMWQYTGDGTCDLPRGKYPTSIANVRNAERNIFAGSKSDAVAFWRRQAWMPGGE